MRLEHWLYTIPLRLRSLFRRKRVEQELDEELQYHIQRKMEENLAAGMTAEEARRAARLEFGGVERRKEECRETRRVNWLHDTMEDLRYAARMLARNPGFALIAVVTLALGIGANTAIFSVVHSTLLEPLPFTHPEQLVELRQTEAAPGDYPLTCEDYLDWGAELDLQGHEPLCLAQRHQRAGTGRARSGFRDFHAGQLLPTARSVSAPRPSVRSRRR